MLDSRCWLRKFLNIYWLRPENAMWRSANALSLQDISFKEPFLESSCGDGLFSFLLAGGEFDPSFDIFGAVGNLEHFQGAKVDIYDALTETYLPPIVREPSWRITVGTDWKTNLIEKARPLGLYREFLEHDNNDRLPFEDDKFETIFSNSSYWVQNVEFHIGELARVLRPGGTAVLVMMNHAINNYNFNHLSDQLGRLWLDKIDRGRKDNYKGLRSEAQWDALLPKSGFRVVDKRPQISWAQSFVEYIGLRPISPYLIEMANGLDEKTRGMIKAKWVDEWVDLLEPFAAPDMNLGRRAPASEVIYILTK